LSKRKDAGPDFFTHLYALILPSGSLDAEPFSSTESTGKTIVVSLPALATGGLFGTTSGCDTLKKTGVPVSGILTLLITLAALASTA
jgi:hypothetical protein